MSQRAVFGGVFGAALFVAASLYAQTLEQQEKCAARAKVYFQDLKAEWDSAAKKTEKDFGEMASQATTNSLDYQSHYNLKLQKCLVLIERDTSYYTPKTGTGFQAKTAELSDAYERRVYASYWWQSQPGKKYWEVPPSGCDLVPTLAEKRTCSSREEWDAFVSPYLQQ